MFRSESSILSLISIILVTLVWISLLLGRLYHQSFVETLGLPSSESHLPLLDYALISPNVTTLGVGLFVSVAIVIVYALSVSIPRATTPSTSIFYAVLSLVLVVVPTLILMILPRETTFDLVGPVVSAVVLISLFFFGSMSALMYAASFLSTQLIDGSSERRSVFGIPIPEELHGFTKRAFALILIPVVIVAVFILCVMYARAFGTIDACNILNNPKVANVEFESSDYHGRLCDSTGWSTTFILTDLRQLL